MLHVFRSWVYVMQIVFVVQVLLFFRDYFIKICEFKIIFLLVQHVVITDFVFKMTQAAVQLVWDFILEFIKV